jgi:hypothetical protein
VVIWRTSRLRELFRPAAEIHQEADESRQFDVVYFAMLGTASAVAGGQAASSSGAAELAKLILWWMQADAWNCLKRSGPNCQTSAIR